MPSISRSRCSPIPRCSTLPDREFRCGLAEVAKYALIGDDELLALLVDHSDELVARDPRRSSPRSSPAAPPRRRVVEADELERTGARAVLNYGHTLAHALEIAGGHALHHGEAVAIGMVFAANLAAVLERIGPDVVDRHERLLSRVRPPGRGAGRADGAVGRRGRRAHEARQEGAGGLTFVLPGPHGIERVDDPDPTAVAKALAQVGVSGWGELMATILLLSGPNLNLLGEREPEVYGTTTLEELVAVARKQAESRGHELEHLQSNHEGALIDAIHGARPLRRDRVQPRRIHALRVRTRRRARRVRGRGRRAAPLEPACP